MRKPKLFEQETYRVAYYADMVTVSQSIDLLTYAWKPALVQWSATSPQTPDLTREFVKMLNAAVKLAEKWTEERVGLVHERREE